MAVCQVVFLEPATVVRRAAIAFAAPAAAAAIASQPAKLPACRTPVRVAIPAKANAALMTLSSTVRNRKGSWDLAADPDVDLGVSRWKLIATTAWTPMMMIEIQSRPLGLGQSHTCR